jgi:hypothetical protein
MENFRKRGNKHFIVLVAFANRMDDHSAVPEIYIVPSEDIPRLIYQNPKGTRRGVTLSRMRAEGSRYKDAWSLFDMKDETVCQDGCK